MSRTFRRVRPAIAAIVLLLASAASAARVEFGIQTPNRGAKCEDIRCHDYGLSTTEERRAATAKPCCYRVGRAARTS
jgi:hypothetical protein